MSIVFQKYKHLIIITSKMQTIYKCKNYFKDKVDSVINAFSHMLTTVYEHMFIPGHVENWIIIIDINNMSLMNVPFKVDIEI